VDDADRFAKLALRYPDLLNHFEQVLWKLIRENGFLWRGSRNKAGKWTWSVEEKYLMFERLREHWDTFLRVARGEADRSKLPGWAVYERAPDKPPVPPTDGEQEKPLAMDDEDIPF
jgi:hypothetical protein